MKGLTVKVYAKAGSGKLFGSIGAAEIAEALKEQYGIDVDKKRIKLEEPIKSLGITDITAHLYEQTDTKFKVEVLPLEASRNKKSKRLKYGRTPRTHHAAPQP